MQRADLIEFSVQRYISCDGANRGKAAELLLYLHHRVMG